MSRTRTLTNLIADVRWQSDTEAFTTRHTDAAITRALNQSIQEFRELISDGGSPYYLTSASITLPVGAVTSGAGYGVITSGLPTDAVRYYGLDITYQGRDMPLRQLAFEERNDFGATAGVPQGFWVHNMSAVYIAPASEAAYPARLWYLPVATDLSAGGDTFDGIVGWEEWVIFNAAVKITIRDDRPELFQVLTMEREKLRAGILNRVNRVRSVAYKRSDERARRLFGRRVDTRWP